MPVPHSSTVLPAGVRHQLLLDDVELAEEMEAVGMGAVYTRTSDGRQLRALRPGQRDDLLARHFHPYHHAFARLVDDQLDRHDRCVIVDVHSYPRHRLGYERHAEGARPRIDLGTDPQHTPDWLHEIAVATVARAGVDHAIDTPFAGTFVPGRHLGDPRVSSLMVEVRRDTYLDEDTARPHAGEALVRRLITDLVGTIAARSVDS